MVAPHPDKQTQREGMVANNPKRSQWQRGADHAAEREGARGTWLSVWREGQTRERVLVWCVKYIEAVMFSKIDLVA